MTPQELRNRRIALGISPGELAFFAHLPMRDVYAMENGEREIDSKRIQAAFSSLESSTGATRPTRAKGNA